MNNFSTTGYKDDSPDRNRNHNIIPGNIITMKGVSKQLTLIPIINGKPDYSKKTIANPGDDDIHFDDNVEGVLELPYAQSSWGMINPTIFQNTLYAPNNLNASMNYGMGQQGASYMENANLNYTNPYVGQQSSASNTVNGMPPSIKIAPPPAYITPTQPTQEGINRFNSMNNTFEMGMQNVETDPNVSQKMQAEMTNKKIDNSQQKKSPFIGGINNYGGWNMENTAAMLGASIQDKNVLGTVASAGKLLLSGFRNAYTGSAAMKKYQESVDDYENRLEKAEYKQGWHWLRDGGNIENDYKKYKDILSSSKILKEEFDSSNNEYIITYE